MKKKLAILLAFTLGLSVLYACGNANADVAQQNAQVQETQAEEVAAEQEEADAQSEAEAQVESVYGFHVDGTKLLDANGNEFIMRGINHAHSWYAKNDMTAFAAIAKTGANAIRIVCSNGAQWSEDHDKTIAALIEQSKKNKMIAILEVHDATGKNDLESLSGVVDYWVNLASVFEGTEAYCILNIANEWVGNWDSDTWCAGYVDAVQRLRSAGIHNTILVDAAGWGQYGKSIAEKGQTVFEADPERNTMFAIHMYGTAGKNEQTIRDNIEGVTGKGLCVCIGEFGYTHSDGDVDEAYLMQYCVENQIGYLGWSWKGNGGGVEYLDIATKWDGTELSSDWGEHLIHGPNGIEETSVICSVYEE